MKTASAAKIAAQFNDYLEACQDQPVLITRNGKPVAVLLAVRDIAQAKKFASAGPRSLRSIFQQAHEQIQQGGAIPHDEFCARSSNHGAPAAGTQAARRDDPDQYARKALGRVIEHLTKPCN
jgi:prevent-host-death family protein